MRGFWTIYRRELSGLFLLPLAWILFCLTQFYNAFFFLHFVKDQTGGEVLSAMSLLMGGTWPYWFLMMFLPPLLTMRMISEESRSGMLEFLLTAPVGDASVVVGKALAASTFMGLIWLSFPLYGLVTSVLGAAPDWGAVATGWLGSLLVSAFFCAIGIVTSALCSTPLLAAFLAVVINVVIVVLPLLGSAAPGIPTRRFDFLIEKIDVTAHFQGSFQSGALDTGHVLFFVIWIAALLFLAVRLVESRRWI